jgi:hypothetical protein
MLTAMFDAPTRVKVTLEDGTTRDFVALAVEVVGVVTPKQQKVAANQPKATRPAAAAGQAPKASPSAIAVRPETPIDGEVARAWLRGQFDGQQITPKSLGALLAVVGFLRRQLFKLDVATMSTQEAKEVREAWAAGAKPSQFCRAVIGASRDPFWVDSGDISVRSIVKNLGRLSRAGATK